MSKIQYFDTKEELRAFETVSPKVSAKYVPIYTSELIEIMEPEFTLINGCKIFPSWSAHYVDLGNEAGDTIRIYNSFDRRWALGVSLISENGLSIKLGGVDRLIHMGQKAESFKESFAEAKDSILESIANAKVLFGVLSSVSIEKELADKITNIVFRKFIKKDGFQDVSNPADILLDKSISVANYITLTLKNYEDGNYTVTANAKKRTGRKTKSVFDKVTSENIIMKLIETDFLEYLL